MAREITSVVATCRFPSFVNTQHHVQTLVSACGGGFHSGLAHPQYNPQGWNHDIFRTTMKRVSEGTIIGTKSILNRQVITYTVTDLPEFHYNMTREITSVV